jgi:hypothetical protein
MCSPSENSGYCTVNWLQTKGVWRLFLFRKLACVTGRNSKFCQRRRATIRCKTQIRVYVHIRMNTEEGIQITLNRSI